MLQYLQQSKIPIVLIFQSLAAAIWLAWFDRYLTSDGFIIVDFMRFIVILALLGFWHLGITAGGKKWFGWEKNKLAFKDVKAGNLLFVLPLLIIITPIVVSYTTVLSMKLTSFVWVPWWNYGAVVGAKVYTALMLAGAVFLSSFIWKLVIVIKQLIIDNPEQVNAKKLFLLGFIVYLALLSWPACMTTPDSGELSQIMVTEAIAYDTALNVDGILGRADYYRYYPSQEIEFKGFTDSLSRLFLPVAPGMPLLFLTFYLIGGRWFASVLVMLFAAGAAAQLYGLCRDQGFSKKASLLTWVVALSNAPLMLYGYQQYEVTAGAFFLIWGIRHAFKTGLSTTNDSIASAAVVGFVAGLIWLGGLRFVMPSFILLGLLFYYLKQAKRTKELLATGAAMALPAFFALLFFLTIYIFFLTHPVYTFNMPWEPGTWMNLLAMFSDRYSGLVWNAPIWLFGLAGLIWLMKKEDRIIPFSIFLILLCFMWFVVVMPDPRAEGSAFNRLLAVCIPMTGIGLAAFFDRVKAGTIWRKVAVWLTIWGAGLMVIQTVLPNLAKEASRLKFGSIFKPLGMIYDALPNFQYGPSILHVVVALLITVGGGYIIYAVWDQINQSEPRF